MSETIKFRLQKCTHPSCPRL